MSIDDIRINFSPGQMNLMNFCLAFIMFGVALNMTLEDFKRVVVFPKAFFVGLLSQTILLPLFTIFLIVIWQPHPSVSLGLILIAACPGGNISNFATSLARGNVALSITLTSVVTLLAIVTTPLGFALWPKLLPALQEYVRKINVEHWPMVIAIIQLIVLPLAGGMLFRQWQPAITQRLLKPIKVLSLIIFIGFILGALAGNLQNIKNHLHHVLLLVFVHNGVAYMIGYYLARFGRLTEPDARAIALETGIQNSGLGLVLIFNFFPTLGGMILVAAWWGVYDLLSSLLLALWWSRRM